MGERITIAQRKEEFQKKKSPKGGGALPVKGLSTGYQRGGRGDLNCSQGGGREVAEETTR